MPMAKKSGVVLRQWYRMSLWPEVERLSHPGFRWIHGLVMQWTGFNNGVIEFTKARHGARAGLAHTEVFNRARSEVLEASLVIVTRPGGRNLPTLYAIANVVLQVTPSASNLGSPHDPTSGEKLGTSRDPMEPKTGSSHDPNWDVSRPKEFDSHIKTARASYLESEISFQRNEKLVTPQIDVSANEEAYQAGVLGSDVIVDHQAEAHPVGKQVVYAGA